MRPSEVRNVTRKQIRTQRRDKSSGGRSRRNPFEDTPIQNARATGTYLAREKKSGKL